MDGWIRGLAVLIRVKSIYGTRTRTVIGCSKVPSGNASSSSISPEGEFIVASSTSPGGCEGNVGVGSGYGWAWAGRYTRLGSEAG